MLRDGRLALPAKITSSISEPRTEVGRVSPITQRRASKRFDLPQPLGPTIAVSPGSMKSSVGSMNDLNPESLSRVNFKGGAPPCALPVLPRYERVERRLQLGPRDVAGLLRHAIHHQGRRCIDVVAVHGVLRD